MFLLLRFAIDHPEGATEIEMMRFLRGEDPFARKQFRVTTSQIMREAVAAGELADRAIMLAGRLKKLALALSKKAE